MVSQLLDSLSAQNLDSWGQKCLARKKTRMTNLLRIAAPDEAIYREIMLALGYKNNKVQFLELSTITPYSEIMTLKDKDRIARALLYRAGLSEDNTELNMVPKQKSAVLELNRGFERIWEKGENM